MKEYKIKSKYETLIYLNQQFYELAPGNELCAETEGQFGFSVYPIGQKQSFTVNTQKESSFYRIFELKDFSVIYLEETLSAKNYYIRTVNNTKIIVSPHKIQFETAEHGSTIPISGTYNSFKTDAVGSLIGVHLSGGVEVLFLYNPENNLISKFEGESINIAGNTITIHSSEKGIAKHAVKTVTMVDGGKLEEVDSTLLYKLSKPEIAKTPKLFPTAFLEAVKLKDYSLARMYLSPELEQKLKNEHLARFFIAFDSFDIVETKDNFQTVLLINSETHQVCTFELEKYIKNITNV